MPQRLHVSGMCLARQVRYPLNHRAMIRLFAKAIMLDNPSKNLRGDCIFHSPPNSLNLLSTRATSHPSNYWVVVCCLPLHSDPKLLLPPANAGGRRSFEDSFFPLHAADGRYSRDALAILRFFSSRRLDCGSHPLRLPSPPTCSP